MRATGAIAETAMLFTWLAEAYALLGSVLRQNYLAEAARFIETTDERP